MKSRLTLCLFAIIFLASCKKDEFKTLVGHWYGVAEYGSSPTGSFEWGPVTGKGGPSYSFSSDGRFSSASDVPEGSGTYNFNDQSGDLLLNFEPNIYGGPAYSSRVIVEKLDANTLLVAYFSNTGQLYRKIEYTRY